MSDKMLALARANAIEAGVTNVEFLKRVIEDVPLPDGSADVGVSGHEQSERKRPACRWTG
jgi:arsenite methyltransferase